MLNGFPQELRTPNPRSNTRNPPHSAFLHWRNQPHRRAHQPFDRSFGADYHDRWFYHSNNSHLDALAMACSPSTVALNFYLPNGRSRKHPKLLNQHFCDLGKTSVLAAYNKHWCCDIPAEQKRITVHQKETSQNLILSI